MSLLWVVVATQAVGTDGSETSAPVSDSESEVAVCVCVRLCVRALVSPGRGLTRSEGKVKRGG